MKQAAQQLICHASVYLPDRVVEGGSVLMENGRISHVYQAGEQLPEAVERYDAEGMLLLPGFIDVHVHGGDGVDVMDAATDEAVIAKMGRYHAAHGTTSLLATTLSAEHEHLVAVFKGIVHSMRAGGLGASGSGGGGGAEVLGIHMEGPYLNRKRCGAQHPNAIRPASREELDELIAIAGSAFKLITLAPEMSGAMELVSYLRGNGVTVSIGHSDADAATVRTAIEAGATHVTHLFNGMNPFHHREPGVAGSALLHDELAAELICDGMHVHPDVVRMVYKLKPHDRIVLVTDAVNAAGCDDGEYTLGGLPIVVEGGRAVLRDGGNLAGSCLTLNRALANTMTYTKLSLAEVLPGLTINPARQIGVEGRKGSIEPGKDADLVVMNADYCVIRTYVKGECVYES